jgi:hypothetical protein
VRTPGAGSFFDTSPSAANRLERLSPYRLTAKVATGGRAAEVRTYQGSFRQRRRSA